MKPYLRSGENRLEIKFQSPVEYARLKYLEQSQSQYPVPPACVPEEYHGECHANHIRKYWFIINRILQYWFIMK